MIFAQRRNKTTYHFSSMLKYLQRIKLGHKTVLFQALSYTNLLTSPPLLNSMSEVRKTLKDHSVCSPHVK